MEHYGAAGGSNNPKKPRHPFPEYENSRFFETGLSDMEPWSVFKSQNKNKNDDKRATAKNDKDIPKITLSEVNEEFRKPATFKWTKKMLSTPPSPPRTLKKEMIKKKLDTPKSPNCNFKKGNGKIVEPVARQLYKSPKYDPESMFCNLTLGVKALDLSSDKIDSFAEYESKLLEAFEDEPQEVQVSNFKERFAECRELYETIKTKELELNKCKIKYHECYAKMLEAFDSMESSNEKIDNKENDLKQHEFSCRKVNFNINPYGDCDFSNFHPTPSSQLKKPFKTKCYTPRSLNATLQQQMKNMEKSD